MRRKTSGEHGLEPQEEQRKLSDLKKAVGVTRMAAHDCGGQYGDGVREGGDDDGEQLQEEHCVIVNGREEVADVAVDRQIAAAADNIRVPAPSPYGVRDRHPYDALFPAAPGDPSP
ncbi:hypothetical protein NMY22_g18609 [Coprinellus aureogranulatus]|nr:hypothetical protein NMY22_g18609 [Coprinellus aureogranulatus]